DIKHVHVVKCQAGLFQCKAGRLPCGGRVKKDAAGPAAPSRPAGGLWFAPPAEPKPKRQKRPKQKNDPRYVAAARELRDRYLEQMNAGLLLPPAAQGKYDVSRALEGGFTADPRNAEPPAIAEAPEVIRLLDAA
ncbi:MAG: hypothetical protein SYC29_13910, partial [Planctomycetota bacterium]|nr:hypothetical protein [Planctomycetota bacterium]